VGRARRRAQEHGLALTGGRVSSTGVAGFTLGSGSGWRERKMGPAADNLRAARVLTADGYAVTASPDENPDRSGRCAEAAATSASSSSSSSPCAPSARPSSVACCCGGASGRARWRSP